MFSSRILLALLAAAQLALAAPVLERDGGSTAFLVGQNYADEWAAFQKGTGKTPAGISLYGDIWGGGLNGDSKNFLPIYAGQNSGYVEVGLSWKDAMTNNGYNANTGGILCRDIASGKFDNNINAFADELAAHANVHYLLRVDYEVSTNLHANTNPSGFDPSSFDLKAYPAAFAHVRQLVSAKVQNIEFVYHPVRGEGPDLYPGDAQVDWNGISIFNNDVCLNVGSTTNCEGQQIDPNVLKDLEWAPKKKIISESAVQPSAASDPEAFKDYLTRVKNLAETYNVAAWVYINSDWTAHSWPADQWGDSRIEANAPVLDWWRQNIGNNPRYTFG